MNLTIVNNENAEYLRKALTFVYNKISKAEIFIELKVSERRNNLDVEIITIIKHVVNDTDNDVVVPI